MARYIDAVECAEKISEKLNIPLGDLVDVFAEIPTADVGPKSEADNLVKEIERWMLEYEGFRGTSRHIIGELKAEIASTKTEVAREIFWEIDKLLTTIITDDEDGTKFIGVDMQKYYALKMKYTEEKK